ncbi:MAG: conjugal transfer protein TraX [Rickettsia endosymbiont of Bryobia graminum]|nr:conjugal transfer protein TraX [Rickettsia endosymbiont of Bryobia graminum]
MKIQSNYQDFLKFIGIVAMIIDHCGLYIFPEAEIMRSIGRIAMPIFCFFAGYNFHNIPRIRVLIVGITLYIFTTILFKQYTVPNILISIFLGQCYLYLFRNDLQKFSYKVYIHVILLLVISLYSWLLFDYGTVALAIMVLGYVAKQDNNLKLTVFISIFISLIHSFIVFSFSYIYLILTFILGVIEYVLMTRKSFSERDSWNTRIISHYVLYIYAIHLMILQFYYIFRIIRFEAL